MNNEQIFVKEIQNSIEEWDNHGKKQLAQGVQSEQVLTECLNGLAHTFLVALDGGTRLSDSLEIKVLANNTELKKHLHEIL